MCLVTGQRSNPHHNNLQQRGVSLASRCIFCCNAIEDIDHTFRYCPFAVQVWSSLAGSKGGNLDLTVKESLSRWKSFGVTMYGKIMSSFLPHAILWALWKERNGRTFDEDPSSLYKVICTMKELVWGWYLGVEVKNKLPLEKVMFDWHCL